MALFSKKNIKSNQYGLREEDIKGDISGFPAGVVVRMMEEQELQGNMPNVMVFNEYRRRGKSNYGFDWSETEAGHEFWNNVLSNDDFIYFFKEYPEYESISYRL